MGKINNRYLNDANWQQPPVNPAVTDSEVHIWRISISQNLGQLNRFKALLNSAELLRAGKYKQQKDQDRFKVSRAVQRIILGRYLSLPPAGLEFILGDNKKPHLIGQDGNIIHYNLSHSADWIILAVAALPVGIDVEFVDEVFQFQDILQDNFSADEIDHINEENALERFFTLWTRKEAILKATGQGLGEHLPITPALDGDHTLHQTLTGSDGDWQLNSFKVRPGYIGAVVVKQTGQSFKFFDAELK